VLAHEWHSADHAALHTLIIGEATDWPAVAAATTLFVVPILCFHDSAATNSLLRGITFGGVRK